MLINGVTIACKAQICVTLSISLSYVHIYYSMLCYHLQSFKTVPKQHYSDTNTTPSLYSKVTLHYVSI